MNDNREQYIAANSEYNFNEDLVTFTLIDESTIARREREGDIRLPAKKIDVPKDERWNTKQMNSKLLAGILNGDSVDKIAHSLVDVIGNNKASQMRNARTMVTQAECGGRQDSYESLAAQGVEMRKVWIATPDDRTRESHLDIDGEEVGIDDEFSNGLEYPADPSGDPEEVWNCRCSMRTHIISINGVPILHDRDETMHSEQMDAERERREQTEAKADNKQAPQEVLHGDQKAHDYIVERLHSNNVKYREVAELSKPLTQEQIINKLAGGDETSGSCVSLAFAYCGNKVGLDVTDFRGGESRFVFANFGWRFGMQTANANIIEGQVKKEAAGVAKVLSTIEKDKEYVLICGRHASIVRMTDEGLQYLEMQSPFTNGWKAMSGSVEVPAWIRDAETGDIKLGTTTVTRTVTETLASRFGCRKTRAGEYMLAEVDSFQKTEEFKDILGYINTATDQQKKGDKGIEK